MDWVIFLLLASGALYVCAFIVRIRKNRDERALEKEVEQAKAACAAVLSAATAPADVFLQYFTVFYSIL